MNDRYVPDFRVWIDGEVVPSSLRASIMSVSQTSGLEGADRVEIALANEGLRWLDHDLLKVHKSLKLELGYAGEELTQVFVGEIVAVEASFPGGGMPTVTIAAHDRRHRLADGTKVRWFAIPIPSVGNFAVPDPITVSAVSLENGLIPLIDPVGAAIAILLGGVEAVVSVADPGSAQKFIRKQANESDYDFIAKIAAENGWEVQMEHGGDLGGRLLRFTSPLDHLDADVTLRYGSSLLEFSPRISIVGQVFSISGYVWVPQIKLVFVVTLGWDWDRMALTLSVYPGVIPIGTEASNHLIQEPLTAVSAPRKILAEILPRLNKRLTASGSTLGDPRIQAGKVLRLEGVGQQFGGLYRVTSATSTIDQSGFRTQFETRKEIWFGSIPSPEQGAIPVTVPFAA
ncbi:MAG: phage late control D family protein [Rhodanobacteraceae bacterium]|nr:phage late control D family protein [Rhodanobacteraceae bacterium]